MSDIENRGGVAQRDLKRIERARGRRDQAETELIEAMVTAHRSGESFRDIGERAGYSYQRVHELISQYKRDHGEEE